MARLLFLLFCILCVWALVPAASAMPARHKPLPGNYRPVYTYYHGASSHHHSFWSMFRHHSGTHKVTPHSVRHRGTR